MAGIPEVVHGLQRHIFNTDVYPDFFSIPTPERPTLTSSYLKAGNAYSFSGVDITPILVNHTVPAAGFIVQELRALHIPTLQVLGEGQTLTI